MIKTSATKLGNLYNRNRWTGRFFTVINREEVEKVVSHKIPHETGYYNGEFPKYLAGFEHCYEERHRKNWFYSGHTPYWRLKPEYEDNRPLYTIKITYTELDITLTDEGREEVQRRYEIHKRNAEKYHRLLG